MDTRFRWYGYIELFITKLHMKEDEIYLMNYIHSLNWLAYFKNKADVEDKNRKNSI